MNTPEEPFDADDFLKDILKESGNGTPEKKPKHVPVFDSTEAHILNDKNPESLIVEKQTISTYDLTALDPETGRLLKEHMEVSGHDLQHMTRALGYATSAFTLLDELFVSLGPSIKLNPVQQKLMTEIEGMVNNMVEAMHELKSVSIEVEDVPMDITPQQLLDGIRKHLEMNKEDDDE